MLEAGDVLNTKPFVIDINKEAVNPVKTLAPNSDFAAIIQKTISATTNSVVTDNKDVIEGIAQGIRSKYNKYTIVTEYSDLRDNFMSL